MEHLVCRGNQAVREDFPARGNPAELEDFRELDNPVVPVDQRGPSLRVLIRHARRSRANRWRRSANGGVTCLPQIASDSARMPNAGST